MDIVAEKIPDEETPAQPPLEREVTTIAPDEPEVSNTPEAAAPKKRGRPVGSRNKPKVIEQPPPEPVEPEVVEEEPPPPPKQPKLKRATKPRAKAVPPPTPQYYEQPESHTPLAVAANMLEILRLEQAERNYRRGQLYKSWIQ